MRVEGWHLLMRQESQVFLAARWVAMATTAGLAILVLAAPSWLVKEFFLYLGIFVAVSQMLASIGRRLGSGSPETGLEYLAVGLVLNYCDVYQAIVLGIVLCSLALQLWALLGKKPSVTSG